MKIIPKKELTSGDLIFDFSREGKFRMNQTNGPVNRLKIGLVTVLGITLLVTLTGCVGWVDGGGGYGGGGWGGGGGYDRGRYVHGYSDRGAASRAAAHPSAGGHAGGGGGGGKR